MKRKNIVTALLIMLFASPVFAQDADMTLIPYRQGDLWGYADSDKKIVIKPEYNEANFFYEGFASVKKGTKFGYINKTGKVIIPFKFYTAGPFRFGYMSKAAKAKIVTADDLTENQNVILFAGASLRTDGYEICINAKGETIPKCPAINENSAPDMNEKSTNTFKSNYSTINKTDLFDKIVNDYKMLGREDSYYIALRNNSQGVFNNKFEVIVPFEYDSIKKINIGGMIYLQVSKNGMHGVLYGNGSPYITADNSSILYLKAKNEKDYFIISKEGKTSIKDIQYRNVVEANYKSISYDIEGGFVLTGNENLKGFYFLNNQLLEPKYADVKLVKGGKYLIITTATGKTGFVNEYGVEFFEEN